MDAWIDRLAQALGDEPLSAEETETLLRAARDVAHRVERRITPLSTFLLGAAVGRASVAGTPRQRALGQALSTLEALVPDADG